MNRAITALTLFLLLLSLAACTTLDTKRERVDLPMELTPDYRPEVVNAYFNEFALDAAARIERTADRIAGASDDPEIQRNALLWKLNGIPAIRMACYRADPIGAAVDTWICVAQMDAFFRQGAGTTAFGPHQPEALAATGAMLAETRKLWASIARTPEDMNDWERTFVEPWVREYPIDDLSFARESGVGQLIEYVRARGGALQQLESLDEQITNLAIQARIHLAELPKRVRWEVDLMRHDLLGPEGLDGLATDIGVVADAADHAADAAARAADVAAAVPDLVREERAVILDEVDRQRRLVMDEVRTEREAIVGAFARLIAEERQAILDAITSERAAVLRTIVEERSEVVRAIGQERAAIVADLDRQRLETLAWLEDEMKSERATVIGDLDRIVTQVVSQSDREIEQLVDIVLIRVVLVIVALIVAAPVVAHVYARIWPQRAV